VLFMPTGGVKKRAGYSKLNTTQWATGGPITRLLSFTTTAGIDYTMVFAASASTNRAAIATVQTVGVGSDTAVFCACYITGSSTWAPLHTNAVSVAAYAGSAVFTHGGNLDVPLIWPSVSATANIISASMPSGAKVVCPWGNYLFLGNVVSSADSVRRGSRIQWNISSTINSWPAAQYIDLDADDGDEITCMLLYKDQLIVFKNSKMYIIHYVGGTLMFQEERVSSSIGCVGPNAYMVGEGTLYFIGSYAAYQYNGSGEPTSISDKIQSQFDQMNMTPATTFDVDSDDENWQILFNIA